MRRFQLKELFCHVGLAISLPACRPLPSSRSRAASTPGSSARPAWSRPSTSRANWPPKSAPPSPPTAGPRSTSRRPPGHQSDTSALLKTVDAFIDSHRAGEPGDRSPLFNAARYLGYAAHRGHAGAGLRPAAGGNDDREGHLVHGPEAPPVGSGDFLWYRVHEPDGTLRVADTVRRISRPVEVDLRGDDLDGDFFGSGQ